MTKSYMKFQKRIRFLILCSCICYVILIARVFEIQILDGSKYQKEIVIQAQRTQKLYADRGNIYDRNNKPLSRNIIKYSISANPNNILNKEEISKTLSSYTGSSENLYNERLNTSSNFVFLERNISSDKIGKLKYSTISGLSINRKYKRVYPHGEIAAQLIGYTSVDDIGISGIEKDLESYLAGKNGFITKSKGWSGKLQKKNDLPFTPPINGNDIKLTIDLQFQAILQKELVRRQKETNAISASGIIMNPQDGSVLAIASTPGYDNNEFSKYDTKYHKCKPLTDQFEPGSTFKVIAAVAALHERESFPNEEFDCEYGKYEYYNFPIEDFEKGNSYLTFSQIIEKSSNIGIIKLAERIGNKNLFNYARKFGFGSKTQTTIRGEVNGRLKNIDSWSKISLGYIAMGHEVAVTAMQIATAYSAIANGGYLVQPRFIKNIFNTDNDISSIIKPKIIRKIASEKTMLQMREMLRSVVLNGTGNAAEIEGWEISGKTGTAQKNIDGKYSDEKFISNFVGFFPKNDAKIIAVIILDEPEKPNHYGGQGAGIAFNRIIKQLINIDDSLEPPKLKNDINYAENVQYKIEQKIEIPLLSKNISKNNNEKTRVPTLLGYSLRRAMSLLKKTGIKGDFIGSGTVISQSLKPGSIIKNNDICLVILK